MLGLNSFAQNDGKIDSLIFLSQNSHLSKAQQAKINLDISRKSLSTEGISYAEKAFVLFSELKDSTSICLALEEMSAHHRKMGNSVLATEELLKALQINEKLGRNKNIAVLAAQIGTLYINDKDLNTGLKYLLKGYESLSEIKDTLNMALACINIGEAYRLADSLTVAEKYLNRGLGLNNRMNNSIIKGYCIGNLGLIHASQEKLEQAKGELSESIQILQKFEDYYSISFYQAEIGNILIKEEKIREGKKLLIESLKLAKKQDIKEQIAEISKSLSIQFEKEKQFETALLYRKQFENYHDSLLNIDNVRKIESLKSQYQLEKKQAEIKLLEKVNLDKKRTVYILAICSIVLVILLLTLLRIWHSNQKAYNILKEQNLIIEKREQEKSLLLRELNHRVKNNLQMVSSLLSLQAFELKDHPAAEALRISKNRVEALMLIHQKLYNNNLHSEINLKEYIEELARGLIFNFGRKIKTKLNVDQIVIPFEQAIPIGLIINELVTNALKYAYIHTDELCIELSLTAMDHEIQLVVTDNGPGLKDLDCKKIQSLGIKLVRSLIEQLNGHFTQENKNGCVWKIYLKPNKLAE